MKSISYDIKKEDWDITIVSRIIDLFDGEEVWLIVGGISREEAENLDIDELFLYKEIFYLKLKNQNYKKIIKQLLKLNSNFTLIAFKKDYQKVSKDMVNDKNWWYYIDFFYSEGRIDIIFDSSKYNKKEIEMKLNEEFGRKIIKKFKITYIIKAKTQSNLTLLFIFTLITFYIASSVATNLSINTERMWTMWLWLPIPILSIILGFKYKKKGYKCQKNILAGFIIGFLLLVFGAYTFFFPNEDYQNFLELESIINVDLPKQGIYTKTPWEYGYFKKLITHTTIFEEYEKLEDEIMNSKTWLSNQELNSGLQIFISPFNSCGDETICYYSFYIKDIHQYNTLPAENGNYHIYAMTYNTNLHELVIDEFDYDYKK